MSKATVIRYQTKPEAADENQRLIEKVFAELASAAPSGLRYTSVRLVDGVTFLHVVLGDGDLLPGLATFTEFQRDFGDRVTAAPERTEATVIGSYAG
jgi:hypothetical protein